MRRRIRCAIYTRKSSEEGLEQEFNSLHAQREACEAFIASQRNFRCHAGNRSRSHDCTSRFTSIATCAASIIATVSTCRLFPARTLNERFPI